MEIRSFVVETNRIVGQFLGIRLRKLPMLNLPSVLKESLQFLDRLSMQSQSPSTVFFFCALSISELLKPIKNND